MHATRTAQVFLNATTSKKQAMHTRLRGVELWMKRKNLPRSYRHRVRQYERQRWAATRGVDECRIVRDLPEGLRRDIKYHLCLGLVRQVRSKRTHRHRRRGVTSRQFWPRWCLVVHVLVHHVPVA